MALESTDWTGGIKNVWQRLLVKASVAIIVTLCTVIAVLYRNMSNTIDYERGQKEHLQKDLKDCNMNQVIQAYRENNTVKETRKVQDTSRIILKTTLQ